MNADRRQGGAGMDRGCRCQDRLHRAGQPTRMEVFPHVCVGWLYPPSRTRLGL